MKRHGDPLEHIPIREAGGRRTLPGEVDASLILEPIEPSEQKSCAVEGCERAAFSRGWCRGHHRRWLERGDVQAGVPFKRATAGSVGSVSSRGGPKSMRQCERPSPDLLGLRCSGRLLEAGPVALPADNSTHQCDGVSLLLHQALHR